MIGGICSTCAEKHLGCQGLPLSALKLLIKFSAVLLLALWLPATQHCDLEAAGILHLGDHATHTAAACSHDCQNDACAAAEGAAYSKLFASLTLPPPPAVVLYALAEITPLPRLIPGSEFLRNGGPPEIRLLTCTWPFARRAALPARAPDAAI